MGTKHSASKRWNLFSWKVNNFIDKNIATVFYLLLSLVILLQQFEATEPLVFGVWWINVITLLFGGRIFWASDWRNLVDKAMCTLVGIAVQVWIVVFHWEDLVWFDSGLRLFRENLARAITGGYCGHLFFGHVLWLYCTGCYLYWVRRTGYWYYPMKDPPYDISMRSEVEFDRWVGWFRKMLPL